MPHTSLSHFERQTAILVGVALMIATYLVFSLRTLIDPVDPGELLSFKRFAAAAVGMAAFWMVVRGAAHLPLGRLRACAGPLALRALAAIGVMLSARVGWDLLVTGETEAMLARNIRWIIAWTGYFAAALLAYFAIVASRVVEREFPAFLSREDAAMWLAAEAATWPEADRRALADLIAARQEYEDADPLFAGISRR